MKNPVAFLLGCLFFITVWSAVGDAEEGPYSALAYNPPVLNSGQQSQSSVIQRFRRKGKVTQYVCGSGGRTAYCCDECPCCFNNATGYYYCCGPQTSCGDSGACW
jgi:hypothetical protein